MKWPYVWLVVFEMLWTHGVMQAFSDFVFQGVSVFWYFRSCRPDYSGFTDGLLPTLSMSFKHFGTIVFGSILTYYPDTLNEWMHACEESAEGCYSLWCCCHRYLCANLSKYGYLGTVMYGQSFCKASRSITRIRALAKHTFPQLYMMGNLYVTMMKIFTILVTIIVAYFLIISHNNYSGNYEYLAPLLVDSH